jgi:hypothetical protein
VTREKLNRWGEPEEIDPSDLPVDLWFPSERDHQSPGMEFFSRVYAPFGWILGFVLAFVTGGLLRLALEAEEGRFAGLALAAGVGALSIVLLASYGTLAYYAIKKRMLVRRRNRGLPVDMDPDDIDEYSVPLFYVPFTGRLMMGPLNSGGKTVPLGMKRARIVTYVAAGIYLVAMLLYAVMSAATGGPS